MKMQKLARHNSGLGGLSSLFSEEDIMTEIFLWLPLKSLIRFKRLSKRWYFLISDQDNSYFRHNYLSTLSSRRRRRNRRIVESGDDDDDSAGGIMAGFFYWKPLQYWKSHEPVRFLPTTSTQFKKYSFLPTTTSTQFKKYSFLAAKAGGKSSTTTTTTTTEIVINKINPFLSFEESLDKFFSARLHEDEEYYPSVDDRKIFVAASSNGFLLCTLHSGFSHSIDFLVNPVTMEWLALPKLEANDSGVYVGFVCKGDYPSLDLVEYTIVRLSCLEEEEGKVDLLLFQLFSSASGDNEWSEYRVSCESLQVEFSLCGQHDTVIVSTTTTTTTTTNNQGGGGGGGGGGGSRRILVYFLVMVRLTRATAIVAIDLNEGDDPSLQMFETPGPDRGISVFYCADYIREFDDGRVIHYVRICRSTDFEFWVFNTESREWYLRHRASLKTMLLTKGYPLTNVMKWTKACMFPEPPYEAASARYHIHAFHPMNPNLIFLTLYGKFACYNLKTGMLELVYDFDAQNMKDDYCHFVYQWPCWPPLL